MAIVAYGDIKVTNERGQPVVTFHNLPIPEAKSRQRVKERNEILEAVYDLLDETGYTPMTLKTQYPDEKEPE